MFIPLLGVRLSIVLTSPIHPDTSPCGILAQNSFLNAGSSFSLCMSFAALLSRTLNLDRMLDTSFCSAGTTTHCGCGYKQTPSSPAFTHFNGGTVVPVFPRAATTASGVCNGSAAGIGGGRCAVLAPPVESV